MKKLFSLIVVILLISSTAFATATRVGTMGGNDQIVRDRSNIGMYPQIVVEHPNLMYGKINGAGTLHEVGGDYALPVGTLALYFTADPMNHNFSPVNPIDQKLGLVYGYDLGGDMVIGLGLSMYGNSYKAEITKPAENKTETSASGLGIDVGFSMMKALDLGLFFNMYSWTHNAADGKVISEGSGNSDFGLSGRYALEMSPTYKLIPYFGFGLMGEGWKGGPAGADGDEQTVSTMVLDLGLGNNMHFADNKVMAVAAVGIQMINATDEFKPKVGTATTDKDNHSAIPYFNLGVEGEMYSWLTLRMGAEKMWHGRTTEDTDGNKESWGNVMDGYFVGAAFTFGGLLIDAQVNPGFLLSGPNFVSGNANDIATEVTLTYYFDKK